MIDLTHLQRISTVKQFNENSVIIEEDDNTIFNMYIIIKGKVGVYKSYGTNDEVMVNTLGPGDFFGEMSLFLHQPRTATVVAIDKGTIVLELNQSNALDLIEKYPDIPFGIIRALCERIDTLNKKIGDVQ